MCSICAASAAILTTFSTGWPSEAAALVTDDYPISSTQCSVPGSLPSPIYAVDSSCIVPMSQLEKREYAAYTIRPKIRKLLPRYLTPLPPIRVRQKFNLPLPSFHSNVTSANIAALVASCEIDHSVRPSPAFRGGSAEAATAAETFPAQESQPLFQLPQPAIRARHVRP